MGLFSRLGALFGAGGATARSAERRPHLAFVLLDDPTMPRGEAIVEAFRELAPADEGPLSIDPSSTAEALQLSIAKEGSLLVSLMPAPVPNREAEESHARSITALGSGGALAPHRAHLVAFFRDAPGRSRYDELTRFTYLLAALAQGAHATAIYWGDAGATHEAEFFVESARERDPDRMLPLWTGFELVQDGAERASMLTLGMRRQLGIMELRVTAPRADLAEYVGAMFDILAYAARRGSAIPAGETIGRSAEERLEVRHEPSPADPKEPVWRIDFP